MTNSFDRYRETYQEAVQNSISFSGLKHDFFLSAKCRVLERVLRRHFGLQPIALADIGCGIGAMHSYLSPLCRQLAACDTSGESLARARLDHPHVNYEQADGRQLPWADASFDVSLAVCVLHHVKPEARLDFLREMRRIVKPGGLVILIEHNPWNPGTRLAVARCPFDEDAELLDWRAARGLLTDVGLQVETQHFLLLPFSGRVADWIERSASSMPAGAQYVAVGVVPPDQNR